MEVIIQNVYVRWYMSREYLYSGYMSLNLSVSKALLISSATEIVPLGEPFS